jgi:hypothetical protein
VPKMPSLRNDRQDRPTQQAACSLPEAAAAGSRWQRLCGFMNQVARYWLEQPDHPIGQVGQDGQQPTVGRLYGSTIADPARPLRFSDHADHPDYRRGSRWFGQTLRLKVSECPLRPVRRCSQINCRAVAVDCGRIYHVKYPDLIIDPTRCPEHADRIQTFASRC